MNIYLAASTERIIGQKSLFKKILKIIDESGYINNNDYLTSLINNTPNPDDRKKSIYNKTKQRVKKSILLICEISDPSITLGTLIEYAINYGIPVLCLCENKKRSDLPTILKYYDSNLFTLKVYEEDTLEFELQKFLSKFKRNKVKFNAFIDSEINAYLEWAAKKNHISKSTLFRKLLVEKMSTDKEYITAQG